MRRLVLLGVVVGVAAEVEAAVLVAHLVGAPLTALLLIGLSVAGWSLLRRRLRRALGRLRADAGGSTSLRRVRTAPGGALYDLVAGVLLVVPGFVSAALGLVLLLPPVRWLTTRVVGRSVLRRVARSAVTFAPTAASPHPGGVRARSHRSDDLDARTVDGDVVRDARER